MCQASSKISASLLEVTPSAKDFHLLDTYATEGEMKAYQIFSIALGSFHLSSATVSLQCLLASQRKQTLQASSKGSVITLS